MTTNKLTMEQRILYSRVPYELAMFIYRQGLECDQAARLIRQRLEPMFREVIEEVKKDMGEEYNPEKEI